MHHKFCANNKTNNTTSVLSVVNISHSLTHTLAQSRVLTGHHYQRANKAGVTFWANFCWEIFSNFNIFPQKSYDFNVL